jgi:hypothetical protein
MPDQDDGNRKDGTRPLLPGEAPPLDLTKFNETTRNYVWAHVYGVAFLEPYMENGGFDSSLPHPRVEADRAELQIFWTFGRWFAAWRNEEIQRHLPPHLRFEIVQIKADPNADGGLMLFEV